MTSVWFINTEVISVICGIHHVDRERVEASTCHADTSRMCVTARINLIKCPPYPPLSPPPLTLIHMHPLIRLDLASQAETKTSRREKSRTIRRIA